MKYTTIKEEAGEKVGDLCHAVGLFWAFSEKQFEENKTPLADGDKYVSIGMGGYLPKSKVNDYISGMKAITKWEKQAIKQVKAEEAILYELNNHEAFYTGTIYDAMPVLEELGYTEAQVKEVYHKHRPFALN